MKNYILLFCFMICAGMVSAQALKVDANGNVGVGTGSPGSILDIQTAGYAGLFLKETSGSGAAQFRFRANAGTFVFDDVNGNQQALLGYNGTFNRMSITSNTNADIAFATNNKFLWWNSDGQLGVGTTAPSRNLHVVGSAGKTDGSSSWDILSDKRLKKNIKKYDAGLEQILSINPVTFNYNGEFGTDASKRVVGVVAQEVKKVAPYMVSEIHLVDNEVRTTKSSAGNQSGEYIELTTDEITTKKEGDFLSLNNDAFTYMLINAVKEQQEMINSLKTKLDALAEIVNGKSELEDRITISLSDSNAYMVSQNHPNPYIDKTVIEYNLHSQKKDAVINFYNLSGQLLKSVKLMDAKGSVIVNSAELPSGTYTYSLEVEGTIIDQKKMVKMH